MGVAAPSLSAEMSDWVALGGGNSGIVPNSAHNYGFHMAANQIGPGDYSRFRDPNGANGPFVNWNWCCAADFSHKNDENLRALHRRVLARLMRGELPMVAEFIGKPWADQPVYYWARWNGVGVLQRYTGAGHDHWSHIALFRSMADQRPYLWVSSPTPPAPQPGKTVEEVAREVLRGNWGNGQDRKNRLTAAGYDYNAVQREVNRLIVGTPAPKTVHQLADEVMRGDWGNGQDRRNRLQSAGYDYDAVQAEVNRRLGVVGVTTVARAVIRGDYGNGAERRRRLSAAGWDPDYVQREVNRLLGIR